MSWQSFSTRIRSCCFLDGLDEVTGEREHLYDELSKLALNMAGGKIIVTCRSGDYGRLIEGFDVIEICPLDPAETSAIATAWLGDPSAFLDALRALPYVDITDRPLLLTQLLYIYQRYGYLPEQPHHVYRRVISLLLEEWDAERGVVRQSKYAYFDSGQKLSFLAAIAYYLTYRIRTKRFTSSDLEGAYLKICDRFHLPREQVSIVIREIETHTGIIVAAGAGEFEFTHLSLQEFLCAEYLSREPHAEHLKDYMEQYPAPVAITVALSSNASSSFAALFLRSAPVSYSETGSFLSRLLLERPFFDASVALGMAVLKVYADAGRVMWIKEKLEEVARLPKVRESIALALHHYGVSRTHGPLPAGMIRLARRNIRKDPLSADEVQSVRERSDGASFAIPRMVCVSREMLNELSANGCLRARELLARSDA